MTQPLTDRQLTEIRDRVAAATDGPWYADGHEILVGTADDITQHSQWIGETCTTELPDWGNANGAFVAHARQDVPALLAEVDRLRAELEQTRQQQAAEAIAALRGHGDEWWYDSRDRSVAIGLLASKAVTPAAQPTSAVRACGCPSRFDRHADGCPTLPAEATR